MSLIKVKLHLLKSKVLNSSLYIYKAEFSALISIFHRFLLVAAVIMIFVAILGCHFLHFGPKVFRFSLFFVVFSILFHCFYVFFGSLPIYQFLLVIFAFFCVVHLPTFWLFIFYLIGKFIVLLYCNPSFRSIFNSLLKR